jgi:hypothetical protein
VITSLEGKYMHWVCATDVVFRELVPGILSPIIITAEGEGGIYGALWDDRNFVLSSASRQFFVFVTPC